MKKAVGNIPVLSDPDIETIKVYIFDKAIEGQYFDVEDFIEKAEELRKERFGNARLFLTICNCFEILNCLHKKTLKLNRLLACNPKKSVNLSTNSF